MNNSDIVKYVLHTPHNTNPAILMQHLEQQDLENGVNVNLSDYVKSVNGVKPDTQGNVQIEIPDGGINFTTDASLKLQNGVLSVNTVDQASANNTLPMSAAGVYTIVGNIEVLLGTI